MLNPEISEPAMISVRKAAPQLLERLQNGSGLSQIQLVYVSHPLWPLPHSSHQREVLQSSLKISVLDSSFNPPTLAHLALTDSRIPNEWAKTSPNINDSDYDAKLLLLSVKNVDKTLKPGDATYLQRLEMMALLTKSSQPPSILSSDHSHNTDLSGTEAPRNVAIAITDEPTFVGKSAALLSFLKNRLAGLPGSTRPDDLELTFLLGLDTLERLFSPRYYHSEAAMKNSLRKFLSPRPEGDNSRVVCAKRVVPSTSLQSAGEAEATQALTYAKEFEATGRIATIDIGKTLSTYSSSAVRGAIATEGLHANNSVWRNFVTPEIADYVSEQQLYSCQLVWGQLPIT